VGTGNFGGGGRKQKEKKVKKEERDSISRVELFQAKSKMIDQCDSENKEGKNRRKEKKDEQMLTILGA